MCTICVMSIELMLYQRGENPPPKAMRRLERCRETCSVAGQWWLLLQGWLETCKDLAPHAPAPQLSISYLSFEQPAEESSLCVGQVLGLAPLNRLRARASGAGSLLLPPQAGEPRRACTRGTKREKSQSNACAESLVWKSRHICSFEIFFKILIIPRATVPPFSKFELMRSPACQIACAPTQREDAAKARLSKGGRACAWTQVG